MFVSLYFLIVEVRVNLMAVSHSSMDLHGGLKRRLPQISPGPLLLESRSKLDLKAYWLFDTALFPHVSILILVAINKY
jgi:hypothetical protein